MRKKYISDDELNRIVKLKQSGSSWLNIQKKIGVPRRSAKKAYEEWERNQSLEELKAARVGVATEELRKHMDQLVDIAKTIIIGLEVPPNLETSVKSDEQINSIWEQKYKEELQRSQKKEDKRGKLQYIRECNMLLKSLKEHTIEKVNWDIFVQWKRDWDKCVTNLSKLSKRKDYIASKLVLKDNNKIIDSINKKRDIDNAADEIAHAILRAIWWNIAEGKFDITDPLFNITYDSFDPLIGINFERESFSALKGTMQMISTDFCNSDISVKRLVDNVDKINKDIYKLDEMLNPLKLKPLILRTRCELCPA